MSSSLPWKAWRILATAIGALAFSLGGAIAAPYLVVDADSGQALIEKESTTPWFPGDDAGLDAGSPGQPTCK